MMISMPKNRKLLIAACLIAAIGLLAPLFQPINGFDTKPEKVLAGDTLYEYVSDRFGGNEILTHTMFEQFLEDYEHVFLANTDKNASDGDTIQTVGREIIITRPSGKKVYIPLVNDAQLETRKYTQVIQNIVVVGLLAIVGLIAYILTDKRTVLTKTKQSRAASKRVKITYVLWSIIVGVGSLASAASNMLTAAATLYLIIITHIDAVLVPAVFINVALLKPLASAKRGLGAKVAIAFSVLAGLYGVACFFIMQIIITRNGWL